MSGLAPAELCSLSVPAKRCLCLPLCTSAFHTDPQFDLGEDGEGAYEDSDPGGEAVVGGRERAVVRLSIPALSEVGPLLALTPFLP